MRYALLEARDRVGEVPGARSVTGKIEAERSPDGHGLALKWRLIITAHMLESRRQYADNGPALSVQAHQFAHDLRIGVEAILPQRMAEDDDANSVAHLGG